MRLTIAFSLVFLGLGLLLSGPISVIAQDDDPYLALVNTDGVIAAVNARYLSRDVGKASAGEAALLLITFDTPGGSLHSSRDMVESILGAEVPNAVYV